MARKEKNNIGEKRTIITLTVKTVKYLIVLCNDYCMRVVLCFMLIAFGLHASELLKDLAV